MSQCPAQVFPGVARPQFECLAAKAAAQGIAISGDSGSATQDHITIAWDYDEPGRTLTLQCTAKPIYVPCATLASRMQSLVDSCAPADA